MNKQQVEEIFTRFLVNNSNPKTELEYINDFTLLISIVLSAQSTDLQVNKATTELFKHIKTPHDILSLGEESLKSYIKSIGLFNSKARNIMKLSQLLVNNFNSIVPIDLDLLQTLPGVGRKTANVFLNCAYNHPTIAVDTHVFRVSNRIGLTCATTVIATESQLMQVVPDQFKQYAHHWLILHGRYICKAKKPSCDKCIINDLCEYPYKG